MEEEQQQQLRSDSPLSHRIVRSFIQFLNSVQPAPGVDVEGLEVVKQCLADVFNVNPSSAHNIPDGDSLLHIFQSHFNSNLNLKGITPSPDTPAPSSAPTIKNTQGEDWSRDQHVPDLSTDELFGQFIGSLEQIRYFKSTPDGSDDPIQMDRASHVFYTAVEDLQGSGCESPNTKTLAESLKSQGNKAMQSNRFSEAIEFYTFAIALNLNNAVYYCNRAAAFTQIHQYAEAIVDCLKAVKIDPNYSKAYSRLGFAYYAQGKYADAIEKGFSEALRLDPNNEHVRENIRVAEQKLREEHQRAQHSQSSGSASRQGQPNHQSAGGAGTAVPFDLNHIPPEIASYIMNMTQRMHSHGDPDGGTHADEGTDFVGQRPAENDSSANGQPNPQSAGGRSTAMPEVGSFFMNMTRGRHSHGAPADDIHADDSVTGVGSNINFNFGEQMNSEDSNASSHHGQPNQQPAGGPSSGMPFNLNDLTPGFASIFSNMTQGRHSHHEDDIYSDDPGIDRNININFGEQIPAEVSGALRSVMEMFSEVAPSGGEDNVDRRPSG